MWVEHLGEKKKNEVKLRSDDKVTTDGFKPENSFINISLSSVIPMSEVAEPLKSKWNRFKSILHAVGALTPSSSHQVWAEEPGFTVFGGHPWSSLHFCWTVELQVSTRHVLTLSQLQQTHTALHPHRPAASFWSNSALPPSSALGISP